MARIRLLAPLAVVAALLCVPSGAQARTPCPAEQTAPTTVNAAQISDAVFCLSNQIRAHFGLPAFRRDARLDRAAALHSLDMGVRNFFEHVNPDGLDPSERGALQGYALGVGENIAYGYANARAVVLGWMASTGHCRNLLGSAVDLGVGTAVVGTPHYTQNFGDYFSRPISATARDACPHTLNLDTLNTAAPAASTQDYAQDYTQDYSDAPAQAAAARSAVSLRTLSLSPRRFRAGSRGTTISFSLSAPATVVLRIERSRAGRHRIVKGGRLTVAGAAGANRVHLKARSLKPGRYRVQVVATDAAGSATRALRTTFSVTRR